MKDYQKLLEKRLKESEREYSSRFNKKMKMVEKMPEVVYPIISEMLNERDPMLSNEIFVIINPIIKVDAYYNGRTPIQYTHPNRFYSFLNKDRLYLENKYGIKAINIKDALKKFYGEFDELNSNIEYATRKKLLYKNEKNLEGYIKKHSSKKLISVINWEE